MKRIFLITMILTPLFIKAQDTISMGLKECMRYAVEHSTLVNSLRYVTHQDDHGIAISGEQYKTAGSNAFVGAERRTTNFDWFKAEEAKDAARLADSYAVFAGLKAAPETSPIAEPAILRHDELMPVQGTPDQVNAVYMIITKNPTSERKSPG